MLLFLRQRPTRHALKMPSDLPLENLSPRWGGWDDPLSQRLSPPMPKKKRRARPQHRKAQSTTGGRDFPKLSLSIGFVISPLIRVSSSCMFVAIFALLQSKRLHGWPCRRRFEAMKTTSSGVRFWSEEPIPAYLESYSASNPPQMTFRHE